jgi:hypothetical protein
MPFYCGKRSAGICVVFGPKKTQRIPSGRSVAWLRRELSPTARLGRAGVIGYACGGFEPPASHLRHLLCLATKGITRVDSWHGESLPLVRWR